MMPKTKARTDAPAGTAQPAKRFQLPSFNFNFGSLTDGTDIPPPLPSPVQEVPTPPKTPTQEEAQKNGTANGQKPNGTEASQAGGVKRAADDIPASPTYSSHGSLRRYLSKTMLNGEEAPPATANAGSRPASSRPASSLAVRTDKKAKRSSGIFRLLRSGDSKRNSVPQFVAEEVVVVKKEPPPPMIPELSTWETKIDTAMGDDLFKGIK